MIGFNNVPAGIRVPWLYAEFDNSNAVRGPSTQPYRTIAIGPKMATAPGIASAEPNSRYLVRSYEQAQNLFGKGSLLALMAGLYLLNNNFNELYCIGVDDDAGGVVAAGSISITGPATRDGSLVAYIGGERKAIAVTQGQSAISIAADLHAVITASETVLVSSAIDADDAFKLNITSKSKGTIGNEIDIRFNYNEEDSFPEGVSATVVAMSNGSTNPDISLALDAVGDDQFISFVSAFNDSATKVIMEGFLTPRFGSVLQNDGYCHYGHKGTLSQLNAIGDARNSQFTVNHRTAGPTHPAAFVSGIVAVVNAAANLDPARPFQTLEVLGVLAESEDEQLPLEDRDILLRHGMSTNKVIGGRVIIERIITSYKMNNAGAADVSYLNLNTLLTLSYIRYDWRNYMLGKYPRHKLGNDGTNYGPGQPIMTPKLGKAEAISKFQDWEQAGLVEGIDQYKADLIVERNEGDRDRLDFLLPPDLMNQLLVMGTQIKFLL